MPAYDEEIKAAAAEGIVFHYFTAPVSIQVDAGEIKALVCIQTKLGQPDASGRRRPQPVEGSEFSIACDAVIPAIGQRTDSTWTTGSPELEMTRYQTLAVNPHTCQTSQPNVFACGDMVTGAATVIEAVAAGHKVVAAMDAFINGRDMDLYMADLERLKQARYTAKNWQPIPDNIPPSARATTQHMKAAIRCSGFDEVERGFDEATARNEATRCINCGGCCECMECVNVCEAQAIDHQMQPTVLEVKVGSIIVATGYDTLDPTPLKQYGYGIFPNVYTSLEFERLSNATGPTGGQILLRDDTGQFKQPPASVALLHCIGSRDVNYHEYCSRVCCMYALKYSHLLKEKVGHSVQVFDFYIDQRCFGKGYEEFYRRCQEEGTIFIRGKVAEITDQAQSVAEQGKLVAIAEDTLLGSRIRVPVDMVILCVAMQARADAQEVGRIFGMNQAADGFFSGRAPQAGPTEYRHGRCLFGRCLSIPQGHTGHSLPGIRCRRQGLVPGGPGDGASPIHHIVDRPGYLRRLSDLHRPVSLWRH